jgi:glycosyltransferase involved in cell wall biosynthesis
VRVLHLTSSFPRAKGDTAGLFLLDVTSALADAGIEVHVVAPHDDGASAVDLLSGVHVHRFRYAPARLEKLAYRGGLLANVRKPHRAVFVPSFLASYRRAAAAEARRLAPDVIHAHWWFPGGLVGGGVARELGIPFVITLHGSDVHIARQPGLAQLATRVLRRADVVATVSSALRAEVASRFAMDPSAIPVLPMPVTIEATSTWNPAPTPPIRLVTVGRLVAEKGYDVLIDAVLRLRDEGQRVTVDLIGDGPDAVALATRAASLGDDVRFHGARSREEIAVHLASAHALVVPSRREGLGMVALEALAVGCPVIASATGGLVELVGDGDGALVPPGDPDALADAIRRLPYPAPRADAVARHRRPSVAADHLRVYESLTGR